MKWAHLGLSLVMALVAMGVCLATLDLPVAVDLSPRGDALEYALSAASLAEGEGYTLRLGEGAYYPPTFTPGFPLLIAAWYQIVGTRPELAYWVPVLELGVTAGLCVLLAAEMAGLWAGLLASGLVVLSPVSSLLGGRVMSDLPATTCLLVGMYLATLGVRLDLNDRARSMLYLTAGGAFGWAVSVRLVYIPIIVIVLLVVWIWGQSGIRRKLWVTVCMAAGFSLALVPMVVLNMVNTGTPFYNGYRDWLPEFIRNLSSAYDLANIQQSIDPVRWPESNGQRYLKLAAGWNDPREAQIFYGWPVWLLVAGGILLRTVRDPRQQAAFRFFFPVAMATACFLATHYLVYFWQDPRFLYPVLPLVAIGGGIGLARLLNHSLHGRRWVTSTLGLVLAVAALWPGTQRTWERLSNGRHGWKEGESTWVERCAHLNSRLELDAVVVTDLDCLLAEHALVRNTQRRHLPFTLFGAGSHLPAIYIHNLAPVVSTPRASRNEVRPRPVFQPDDLEPSSLPWLKGEAVRGRPAYLAIGDLDSSARELARLREVFQLESVSGEERLFKLSPLPDRD